MFWHDDVLLHDTGSGVFEHDPSPLIEVSELHPENDVRIRNIRSALRNGPIAGRLRWRDGRQAEIDELVHLHEPAYVEEVREFCLGGGGVLAWSTRVCEGSWPASLAAAGTALEATRAVLDGEVHAVIRACPPTGHHALHGTIVDYRAHGAFCLAEAYWQPPDGEPIGPMALEVHCRPHRQQPPDDGHGPAERRRRRTALAAVFPGHGPRLGGGALRTQELPRSRNCADQDDPRIGAVTVAS